MRISDWSSDVCSSDLDKTIAANSDAIAPARTAADALRLNREGKLIAFKSMENSYPLGEDLSLLQEFYDKGLRLAGPVHSKDNQFADSATGEGRWKGLSPLGKQWVAEMNRLDRKSVEWGKSVSVREDLGGGGNVKK